MQVREVISYQIDMTGTELDVLAESLGTPHDELSSAQRTVMADFLAAAEQARFPGEPPREEGPLTRGKGDRPVPVKRT